MNRRLFACVLALWSVVAAALARPTSAQETGDALTQCQEEFKIDLLDTLDALPDATPDAQLDQIRDWIWTTVLARVAAQSQRPELLASVARQPLFRDDSLSHLLEQPVGRTRAAVGKDGTVHVMVQRSTPEQEKEDILEAIDQEAFYLGEAPKSIQIYKVKLLMGTAEAEVCKLGLLDTQWVQAEEQGFRNARVTTADQLGAFLDGGIDLLAASCHTDKNGRPYLDVSGRQRARAAGASISVAHVTALARKTRYIPIDQLPVSAGRLSDKERTWARKLAGAIDSTPPEALRQALANEREILQFVDTVLAWKRQHSRVPTDQLVLSLRSQGGGGLGFSLDPKTDIPASMLLLDRLIQTLPSATRISAVLEGWQTPSDQRLELASAFVKGASFRAAREKLVKLRDQVQKLDPSEAEAILLRTSQSAEDPVLAFLIEQVLQQTQYQVARYDGPLQGTEPAMTMFYTDLVAKLWALDWERSSPVGAVPGFVSVIADRGSPAHCEADRRVPSTRIWFGSRREGYARGESSGLQLAPNATRLYAKGSALGADPSDEVEPSSDMLRFIRWWDRHYSDVATWEPQYELLNQLVKWTLVRGMAEAANQPGCLAFLDDLDTGRKWRFDEWVTTHTSLRWHGKIPLVEKPGEPTETLELIESDPYDTCGAVARLSGGVTLPGKEDVRAQPVRRPDPALHLRRVDPDRRAQRSPSGDISFASIERPTGRLERLRLAVSPEGANVSASLMSDIGLRWADGFWTKGREAVAWSKQILFGNGGTQAEARESSDGFGFSRLIMQDLPGPTVRIEADAGPRLRSLQLAREISFRMQSEGGDLKSAAKKVVGELPVLSLDDGSVAIGLVPPDGSGTTYTVLKSGGGIRGPPPPGIRMLAGTPGPRDPNNSKGDGKLGILLLTERNAQPYLERASTTIVAEPDPIVGEVRSFLSQGDLANARMRAESAGAPPRAMAVFAVGALHRGDLAAFESSVDRLLHQSASSPDLLWVQRALEQQQIKFTRENPLESTRLLAIQTRLAIQTSRLPSREAAREFSRWKDNPRKDFLAPREYSEAGLPPVGHSPSETLPPNRQFVLELVTQASRWNEALPKDFGHLQLRLLPKLSGKTKDDGGPLPGFVRPLYVVVPCRAGYEEENPVRDNDEIPSCFRPNGEPRDDPYLDNRMSQIARSIFECDQNGNGEFDEAGSPLCLLYKIAADQQELVQEHPMP